MLDLTDGFDLRSNRYLMINSRMHHSAVSVAPTNRAIPFSALFSFALASIPRVQQFIRTDGLLSQLSVVLPLFGALQVIFRSQQLIFVP
jgi:hypothetical protein